MIKENRRYSMNKLGKYDANHHLFISYVDEDNNELAHYTEKFGYTDYSKYVDTLICANCFTQGYLDENGHLVSTNRTCTTIQGRELILLDDNNNITFDEWVYVMYDKHNKKWIYADINGYELIFDGGKDDNEI